MFSFSFINSFNKKEVILFVLLYLSLLVSYILGENSTGGAKIDYPVNKQLILNFSENFITTLLSYDEYSHRHSPVLLIFLSLLKKLNFNDEFIRIIHLHISLLLPIFFFQCLKIKYSNHDKKILLFLTSLIFLSPTFRTLAIWPDSRLLGLTVFCLSIYFYLKFDDTKKYKYCILNILFCVLSSYISPNFAVFSVYFFYKFFIYYKSFPKKYLLFVLINSVLAVPFLYYVFILDINFLDQKAATNFRGDTIFFVNIFNNFCLISSIIFFYLLPFVYTKVIKINTNLEIKKFLITVAICLIAFYFFDYQFNYTGGGVFYKSSYFIFENNYLFFIICFISIFFLLNIFVSNYENLFLFILLVLSNPQVTVYHKYYDPFLMILFFSLFGLQINLHKLKNNLNILIIYSFFFIFLIISNIKFLWMI